MRALITVRVGGTVTAFHDASLASQWISDLRTALAVPVNRKGAGHGHKLPVHPDASACADTAPTSAHGLAETSASTGGSKVAAHQRRLAVGRRVSPIIPKGRHNDTPQSAGTLDYRAPALDCQHPTALDLDSPAVTLNHEHPLDAADENYPEFSQIPAIAPCHQHPPDAILRRKRSPSSSPVSSADGDSGKSLSGLSIPLNVDELPDFIWNDLDSEWGELARRAVRCAYKRREMRSPGA